MSHSTNKKGGDPDNRVLSLFSLVILVVSLFGAIIIGLFNFKIALIFFGLAMLLSLILGIVSWPAKIAKVSVITAVVIIGLAILAGGYFVL